MKWLHQLLKGASLTGALFVFQACYGTPMPSIIEESGVAPMSISLRSTRTGEPLEGIEIQAKEYSRGTFRKIGTTGADGACRVEIPYVRNIEGPFLRFEDPEEQYVPKDTSLADLYDHTITVKMTPVE